MPDPSNQESVTASRIDPALLKTVVRLTTPATSTLPASIGTGFLVSPPVENAEARTYFLITNKHVVGDWTLADGNFSTYYPSIEMMLYGGVGGAFTPVTIPLLDSNAHPIPNRIMSASESVVDGYPRGVTSLRTSHPIAKAGYLASLPGEEFAIDVPCENRNGVRSMSRLDGKLLVVDGLIVPGNSGGPVVLPSELKVRRAPDTNQLEFADRQTLNYVIGIVSMGLGDTGLTLVYSSDYIVDLVDSFVSALNN